MKTLIAVLLVATVAIAVSANEKPKNVYKLVHLTTSEAILVCQNGADPTVKNVSGSSIVISCGATMKAKWDGKQFVCPAGLFVWPDDEIPGQPLQAFCGDRDLN